MLVGNTALLSDLTLGAGERIVFGEKGNGSRELPEEVVLALCHFLHIGLCPLVIGQLVIHYQKALVVQDVPVVVVVQNHGRATVVPHVLHRLGVWNGIGALLQHVGYMVWVQRWVNLWVQTVHQLHTVGSSNTVCPCSCSTPSNIITTYIIRSNPMPINEHVHSLFYHVM